jgi:hypothetical protein
VQSYRGDVAMPFSVAITVNLLVAAPVATPFGGVTRLNSVIAPVSGGLGWEYGDMCAVCAGVRAVVSG